MSARKHANEAALAAIQAIGGPAAVQQVAQQFGSDLVNGVIGAIERSVAWKQISPCAAAAYHAEMYRRIRPWRWLARMHHRRLENVWSARCSVEDRKLCRLNEAARL